MRKFYVSSVIASAIFMLGYTTVKKTLLTDDYEIAALSSVDSIPKKIKKDIIDEDIKRLMPPVPASFSSSDSARLIANWRLGIKFYKANCASCHGIFGKGKDSIPNFSKEEMDDYQTAFLAGDKLNHAVMSMMTTDELSAVFLFITNIKR